MKIDQIKTYIEANEAITDSRDALDVISYLEANLPKVLELVNRNSLCGFVYKNINFYNRFSVPTPYVLEDNYKEIFNRLLDIFVSIEGSNENYAIFQIDKIFWDLIECLTKGCNGNEIKSFVHKRKGIKAPSDFGKKKEFNERLTKINGYLSGHLNSNLKTIIKTIIPVSPVRRPTRINTKYQSRDLIITLSPQFYDTPQSFLKTQAGQISVPSSSSQWQNSICNIEIIITGFLDPMNATSSLAKSYGDSLPHNSWPSIFTDTFYIVENLCWQIYNENDQIGRWNISPSDLASIEWEVWSNKNRLDFIIKDPPSLTRISTQDQSQTQISIQSLDEEMNWYFKCLKIAKDKLGKGETNESLFWLNIGIEHFLQERTRAMLEDSGMSYESLNSGRSYWDNAKKLVEEQLPEQASMIKWPESSEGVPSWFTKIKYLDKQIGLKTGKKEVIKNYSKIQKHRNSLFHGSTSERIESAEVEKAIKSFEWLIENFKKNGA